MNKFRCENCKRVFETEGIKQEYVSVIYGPCWKREANCPDCNELCNEYHPRFSGSKQDFDSDNYVKNLRLRGAGCNPGDGCCG